MFDSSKIVHDERKAYRIFLVSLTLIILILFSGIFLGVALRNTTLVKDVIVKRAQGLFQQIVLTRRWAAEYGGVYVKKGPGVESNPWLIHPDLEAADGSMLTLRNPALITREISEIADRQEGYRFRITSLKPLNPGNAADDFERRSLQSFETGLTETWETVESPAGKEFRYMGALKTIAQALQVNARTYDIVGRYGGEEFLVIFPGEVASAALAACERMRASISRATAAVMPRGRAVTVSIGLADLSSISVSTKTAVQNQQRSSDRSLELIEALLRNSDAALYQAKAAGKNRCTVFQKET